MSMGSSRLSLVSLDLNDLKRAPVRGEMKREKSYSSLAVLDGNPLQSSGDGRQEFARCTNVGKNSGKMSHPSDLVLNNTLLPLS